MRKNIKMNKKITDVHSMFVILDKSKVFKQGALKVASGSGQK